MMLIAPATKMGSETRSSLHSQNKLDSHAGASMTIAIAIARSGTPNPAAMMRTMPKGIRMGSGASGMEVGGWPSGSTEKDAVWVTLVVPLMTQMSFLTEHRCWPQVPTFVLSTVG